MNKRNYQRELDDLIKEIETEGQASSSLLLCTLQQLCAGISVPVF